MSTKEVSRGADLFSNDRVHQQLQKIFVCSSFSVSDILRRFLTYIVVETLAGRSNTLKEYTIAVNVLNKPLSFKPQHDAIVRIHAGRLRRALNNYYKDEGIRDPIEITVPKGSYVPVLGIMKPNEFKFDQDSRQLVLPAAADTVTLIVMPFRTFETDISRLAFTDSLGQQMSAEFGKFTELSVISYYSTQLLSLKNREIRELASNFGAQYVVTGNVQFETRRLRVAVQLTDTITGKQAWTELYHRRFNASNLFEIADDIVSHVIAVLGDFNGLIMQQMIKGFTKSKSGKSCPILLSRYMDFYYILNEDSFKKTFAAMHEAVKLDPSNEAGWAFLGQLSILDIFLNFETRENPITNGLNYARTAIQLKPQSRYGHIALAMAHISRHNKVSALDALEYALSLNSNASGTTGMIGCLMICAGEYTTGYKLIMKSINYNKYYPFYFHLFVALYYYKLKDYSTAYQHIDKMGIADLFFIDIIRIAIFSQMGFMKEARERIRTLKNSHSNKHWKSKEFLCRFLLDEELVEHLYNGLNAIKVPMLTVA